VSSDGNTVFRGDNPPDGAILQYYVRAYTGDNVKVSITNAAGTTVANLSAPGTPGFGRIVWNLRPTSDLLTEYGGEGGDKFLPSGDYTITMSFGKLKQKQTLKVTIAPGIETR
jgi:hypothetical protein